MYGCILMRLESVVNNGPSASGSCCYGISWITKNFFNNIFILDSRLSCKMKLGDRSFFPNNCLGTLLEDDPIALWVIFFTAGGDREIFASNHHHILQNPF